MGYRAGENGWFTEYWFCYYGVMMMIMGDNTDPTDRLEVFYTAAVVFLGGLVNATLFAQMGSLVTEMNSISNEHQVKQDFVTLALKSLAVPAHTADRVRAYFEYVWVRTYDYAGDSFIKSLPEQLKTRVSFVVHEPLIKSYPLFSQLSRKIVSALAAKLTPEVYLPKEYVLIAGSIIRSMYFISRGKVQIACRNSSLTDALTHVTTTESQEACQFNVAQIFTVNPNVIAAEGMLLQERVDYFGEFGLWSDIVCAEVSVRAVTHCDVYALTRSDFDAVLLDFPEPSQVIIHEAEQLLPFDITVVIKKRVQAATKTKDSDGFRFGGMVIKRGGVITAAKTFKHAKSLNRVGLAKRIRKYAVKNHRRPPGSKGLKNGPSGPLEGTVVMMSSTTGGDGGGGSGLAIGGLQSAVKKLEDQIESVRENQEKTFALRLEKLTQLQKEWERQVDRRLDAFFQAETQASMEVAQVT